ncbi:MAG: DUF1080 domain-containing protein [Akkermansiaceae bacterium]
MLRWLIPVLVFSSCQNEQDEEPQWRHLREATWSDIQFGGQGETSLVDDTFALGLGVELTGIKFEDAIPTLPYELTFSARKLTGTDFFCGLTFPVRSEKECLTFILGGWGGGTVGLSSIDGKAASENETTSYRNFDFDRWYEITLRVTEEKIFVMLDRETIIDFEIGDHELELRYGAIDLCAPFGLSTFQTASEIRNLRWRSLSD